MHYKPIPIQGAYLIEPIPQKDQRGSFSRLFCDRAFKKEGLEPHLVQVNHSHSSKKGTLRGLHYQLPPMEETKIVRCIRGAIYDVICDMRPDSPSYGKQFGTKLSPDNLLMMYVPRGCAHGFLTLEDDSEAIYFASQHYSKELERGVRWNDPFFQINWPERVLHLSDKDANQPDFNPEEHEKLFALVKPKVS